MDYRELLAGQLAELPARSIVARCWPNDPEPELYRRSASSRAGGEWACLSECPRDYDWDYITTADLHSEYALFAVVYDPRADEAQHRA